MAESCPGPDAPPSDWLLRFAHLITPGGVVADVACGAGRHVRWLLEQGFGVVAFDRDLSRLDRVHPRLQRREVELQSDPGFSFAASASTPCWSRTTCGVRCFPRCSRP